MIKRRSIGFIAAALLAGGVTTALCFGDALSLASAQPTGQEPAISPPPTVGSAEPVAVLSRASPWLNGLPHGQQVLRGKVVVVNFWTYSCINSLRALPYLRAWSERYRSQGLVVVGVHAPEFAFEKDPGKVRRALGDLRIPYPNVQDNQYSVWRDFGNDGWPGFYFVDASGRVRGYSLGEGHYDEAERLIRKLLAEAGHDISGIPAGRVVGTGIEAEADWKDLRSPESYVGYAKAAHFVSPGGIARNAAHSYASAANLSLNQWDLVGRWRVGREFATLDGSPGAMRYRFHARDLHLVLGGAADGKPVRFRVTIDGAAPGASHGVDVDAAGWGEVQQDRLYQLVRQSGTIGDRTVRIEFARPGVRAYVFTFG